MLNGPIDDFQLNHVDDLFFGGNIIQIESVGKADRGLSVWQSVDGTDF